MDRSRSTPRKTATVKFVRARRYDAGALESGRAQILAAGGIAIPAFCTRIGVFPYADRAGATRNELRLPQEVFDAQSLASLAHAPVTIDHPPTMVNPQNWRQYSVGAIAAKPEPLDQYVSCCVVVNDADALLRIDTRELCELSCGYDCDLYAEPGEWEGIPYDLVQRRIRYNHVALLPQDAGRAGNTVALRLDRYDAVRVVSDLGAIVRKEEVIVMALRIDGKDVPAGEEQKAVDALIAARDSALGRADVAEKRADAAEKKGPDTKAIEAAARQRADLLYSARVLAKRKDKKVADDLSGTSNSDLMVQLIKLADPSIDLTGKSPDYILGVFEALVTPIVKEYAGAESAEPDNAPDPTSPVPPPALDSVFQTREPLTKTTQHADSVETARQEMIANNRKRGGLPAGKAS